MAGTDRITLAEVVEEIQDYAIIALDRVGTIESWNLGAERAKGYRAEEAIGHNFEIFYPLEERLARLPARLLEQARAHGRVEHAGWRMRKDGTRFWADVVITALHDPQGGELTGFAKVTRDRTDLKALEDARYTFYRAFDHDFRTPLTALKGFAEAIQEADDDTRGYLVERIATSADRVMQMVEALMKFATGRAVEDEITFEPVELVSVSRSVSQDLPPGLRPQRVRVTPGRVVAWGNCAAIYRVVTNLLVNALKYSPPDTEVVVDCDYTDDDHTRLSVTDHGRGIASGDLDRIFEAFERGRLAQEDGGTGLGLTSARDLVHQQGGILWIDSDVGFGTTVTVELPVQPSRVGHEGG